MRETICIEDGLIVLPNRTIERGNVWVEHGKIMGIGNMDQNPNENTRLINATGKYVLPGFIDVHVHGGGGGDVMDGSTNALDAMTQTHARFGTTGMLATTVTSSQKDLQRSVEVTASYMNNLPKGAKVLGIHLEGPYIHPKYKGAQNEKWVRAASIDEIKALTDLAKGSIKWMTLAPELLSSKEITDYLRSLGVVCSIGHTSATYNDVCRCIRQGFTHVTHLFNAMPPLHHREVGTIGAAMIQDELTYEIIADGIHVSPEALRILAQSGTLHKMMLITDAIRAAGMGEGKYDLGGQDVFVTNGQARLSDGTLAGSVLTMNQALHNIMKFLNVPIEHAVEWASLRPATKLQMDDSKGSIEVGKDADLVVADTDLNVEYTLVEGTIVFAKAGDMR